MIHFGEIKVMSRYDWENDPDNIPDDEYVSVSPDGHLQYRGQRIRFWGHIGHFPNPRKGVPADVARRDLELSAKRMADLGFNLHRLWHDPEKPFEKGDGSREDLRAYGVSLLRQHGIRVWFATLNRLGTIDADVDVNVIDDPDTADEWKDAVRSMAKENWRWDGKKTAIRANVAQHWDPRLQALTLKRMEAIATYTNPYIGIRNCDDPNNVIWELSNEEWWLPKMTRGVWLKLPKLFQRQLLELWHEYLQETYGSNDALIKAWGFLLPGESLEDKTVLLAPTANSVETALLNDPNPHAQAALDDGAHQAVSRDDFTPARSQAVIDFFLQILVKRKAKQANMVKSLGKASAKAPLCWDTGTGWQIQCQYLHQHADAVTHCTYVNGKHHERDHKRFPFNSALEELPRLCWDKPWLEHNKAPNKPFFVYESQIKTSTKYRVEFPYEIATLGCIQDWDVINWHTFGPGADSTRDEPYTRALEVGHSLDLHFGGDEVQQSGMLAAGHIFRDFLVKPAADPTLFVFGRKMLYHPDSMDYAGSYGAIGDSFVPTTYRHGMRLLIDPTVEDNPDHPLFERKRQVEYGDAPDDEERAKQLEQVRKEYLAKGYMTIGPVVRPRIFEPCPIRPTDEIAYDWHHGNLQLDSAAAASFVGFYGALQHPEDGVRFEKAGVTLRDVSVRNPDGIAYPVEEDERYIGFSLTSTDGMPLSECDNAIVSLVSTSFNTGFELDTGESKVKEFAGAQVAKGGDLPVLVARVAGTIECAAIDGMTYRMVDFEQRELATGMVEDESLAIPADQPVWFIELTR